jgi:hypothetical protein
LSSAPKFSRDAAFLLKECAADPNGQVLHLSHLNGSVVQVRGKNLIEENNERSRATWIGALEELERNGLLRATGPKRSIFKITKEGFDAADRLS